MVYRETLFFIGRCLSLRQHPEHLPEIREVLKSGKLVWEQLLWISSSQLVLPALFINLRYRHLLSEMPADLVEHMTQLHKMTVRRNDAIMAQVEDINEVLARNGIKPIYIKGVAHYLDGLYVDAGERMLGDIDFLLPPEDLFRAVEILKELGYKNRDTFFEDMLTSERHFPRLINPDLLGAVEIHWQSVASSYSGEFSFERINRDKKLSKKDRRAFVMSGHHQLIQTMMNMPVYSDLLRLGQMDLKHQYDLFLLSGKNNSLEAVKEFGYYPDLLNAQLFTASKIFGEPSGIKFFESRKAERYFRRLDFLFQHQGWQSFIYKLQFFTRHLIQYICLPVRSLYSKSARRTLVSRVGNPSWYKKHLQSYKKLFS